MNGHDDARDGITSATSPNHHLTRQHVKRRASPFSSPLRRPHTGGRTFSGCPAPSGHPPTKILRSRPRLLRLLSFSMSLPGRDSQPGSSPIFRAYVLATVVVDAKQPLLHLLSELDCCRHHESPSHPQVTISSSIDSVQISSSLVT